MICTTVVVKPAFITSMISALVAAAAMSGKKSIVGMRIAVAIINLFFHFYCLPLDDLVVIRRGRSINVYEYFIAFHAFDSQIRSVIIVGNLDGRIPYAIIYFNYAFCVHYEFFISS